LSKRESSPHPVIEWSPTVVRVLDPATQSLATGSTLSDVRSHIGGRDVVVALSRRSSFIRTARLPNASKAEVSKVLALQVGTLFPVDPSSVAVDFHLTEDRNAEGRLAVVAAVRIETLEALHAQLDAAGLKTVSIVPEALGAFFVAKHAGKRECAIVERVPEGLAIDIVSEGELRASRVVPMPPLDMVGAEVDRSFAVAKLPCAAGVSAGGFSYPDEDARTEASCLSELSGAVLPIHLERPDVVAKRERSQSQRTQRIAIWLWIAVILLAAVVWDGRATSAQAIRSGEARWRKRIGVLTTTKNQAEARLATLNKVRDALALGFEPKQRQVEVVAIASNLVPQGVWLTGVTLERGKPALVRGTSTTGKGVTVFLQSLAKQQRFRDVQLVFANQGEIEGTPVVQFSISMHVVGNLPLDTKGASR